MRTTKQNLERHFSSITDYFSPKIIAEVNDVYVKLVRVKGDMVPWHTHDGEDELFLVLEGSLVIEEKLKDPLLLTRGELYVVEKGTEHRVYCNEECRLMLIENKTTEHTGKVRSVITKTIGQQHY